MTASPASRNALLTFSGTAAVVTGAASGIGRATSRLLIESGVRTIRIDLSVPDPFRDLAPELQDGMSVDVTDATAVDSAFEECLAGGPLSYVVNCAGILRTTGFADVDRQTWLQTLEVNLVGAYNVIDAARPRFRTECPSSIVNVTSVEASHVVALSDPDPTPHYAASKAALTMLTKTSARALAPSGTRVNSIAPGFVATPMAAAHGDLNELPAALKDRVPLQRFAASEEIAWTAAFLLSDQASFITGAEILVDGGFALT